MCRMSGLQLVLQQTTRLVDLINPNHQQKRKKELVESYFWVLTNVTILFFCRGDCTSWSIPSIRCAFSSPWTNQFLFLRGMWQFLRAVNAYGISHFPLYEFYHQPYICRKAKFRLESKKLKKRIRQEFAWKAHTHFNLAQNTNLMCINYLRCRFSSAQIYTLLFAVSGLQLVFLQTTNFFFFW